MPLQISFLIGERVSIMKYQKKSFITRIIFVFPALFLFSIFALYPFLSSIVYSFTSWDGVNKGVFIGLDNYSRLFSDPDYYNGIKNTLVFCFFSVIIGNTCAILLALLLNRKMPGRGALRTIFYMPVVMSLMVVSLIWSIILNYDGAFNFLLNAIGLSDSITDWLGDYKTSIWAMNIILQWLSIGSGVVYYLAGLNSIPDEIYEASDIDGAKGWIRFTRITLPLLMPAITIVTFLALAGSLKLFDLPYILTGGGGGATTTMAMHVYTSAFVSNNFGYATAAGIVLFVFVCIVSLFQVTFTRKREVEY